MTGTSTFSQNLGESQSDIYEAKPILLDSSRKVTQNTKKKKR